VQHGMGNLRLTLGIVAYLAAAATGCTSTGQVGEVREVGQGTYSIGVGSSLGGGILQGDEALKATVDKAGQYCHSKGQKLVVTATVGRTITFRCVSDYSKPQMNPLVVTRMVTPAMGHISSRSI
jgi:hypothetical protein